MMAETEVARLFRQWEEASAETDANTVRALGLHREDITREYEARFTALVQTASDLAWQALKATAVNEYDATLQAVAYFEEFEPGVAFVPLAANLRRVAGLHARTQTPAALSEIEQLSRQWIAAWAVNCETDDEQDRHGDEVLDPLANRIASLPATDARDMLWKIHVESRAGDFGWEVETHAEIRRMLGLRGARVWVGRETMAMQGST
jgi:hypothetical protein